MKDICLFSGIQWGTFLLLQQHLAVSSPWLVGISNKVVDEKDEARNLWFDF